MRLFFCRSINDEKMQKFFKNDFTQERWRKAALKNAYSLLGLQRFNHAAAFFLLAGSLTDAIDVSNITATAGVTLLLIITVILVIPLPNHCPTMHCSVCLSLYVFISRIRVSLVGLMFVNDLL